MYMMIFHVKSVNENFIISINVRNAVILEYMIFFIKKS
jgi:hypothetical protein